jgi:5-methylcytosine-specific restriction protein A
MTKLQSLKPRVANLTTSRLTVLRSRPDTVERKRGSAGVKDRQRIKARDFGLCVLCSEAGFIRRGVVVDHILPLWAGGSDEDENKQTLCTECHDAKTATEAAQRASGQLPR